MRLVKATYVFLDADVFVQSNFDYTSARFKALTKLAGSQRIQVFTTDLTIRELRAKLKELVERGVSKPVVPILRNSRLAEVQCLFTKLNVQRVLDELDQQLNGFLQDTPVHVLEVRPGVLRPVLDAYFEKQPPVGPGKAKAEFPDAMALQTLKDWCNQQQRNMAVVSNDGAVQRACAQHGSLYSYENLGKYLDAVTSEDEMLSDFVRRMVVEEGSRNEIFRRTVLEVQQVGACLMDIEGELDAITLTGIEFDETAVGVLELSDNRADVEIFAGLSYTSEISYDAVEIGGFVSRVADRVRSTDYRTMNVIVAFEGPAPQSFRIEEVSIGGVGIGVQGRG